VSVTRKGVRAARDTKAISVQIDAHGAGHPVIGRGTPEEGGGPLRGGLRLMNRFAVEVTDPAVPYRVTMIIAARDGWLECESVQVSAAPGGSPVTAMAIRSMTLSLYIAKVREELGKFGGAFLVTQEVARTERSVTYSPVGPDAWDVLDYAQRRRNAQLTTEVVAAAYREALSSPNPRQSLRPTAAVAERLHASRGHISRLLTAGRREGLPGLGPARSAGDPRNRGKNTSDLAPTAPKVAADGPAASRDEPRPVPPEVAKWMKTLIPGPEDGDPAPEPTG
jgi:hypothetical protein